MLDCTLRHICPEKHLFPVKINTHIHEYDELTYFITGKGNTKISGAVYPYTGGSFAYYRAGTQHDETNLEACDIIWTLFDFRMEGLHLTEGVFSDSRGELLSALRRLRHASLMQGENKQIYTEICLAEVIAAAERRQNARAATGTVDWQEVLDYMDENHTGRIDISALARDNGYSYDRFRHMFKERFGVSPHSYLVSQRIEHAKRLLESSSFSLIEIAYDCGFGSSSQFCNIFKKYQGLTPGEYRSLKTGNK